MYVVMAMELNEVFVNAKEINLYVDGAKSTYNVGDNFNIILGCWNKMLSGGYTMPAFGVSLHAQTVAAMQKGIWIEFDFGKKTVIDELPFNKLLINIQKDYTGFNIIRYNSKIGYDGRCFYYSLSKDMSELYNLILSQLNNK